MELELKKAAAGESEALQSIFSKKGYSVYAYAMDLTTNREIAKNVTKEVFHCLPDELAKKEIHIFSEEALDRLLISKTKELCNSFQDLASIQSELFNKAKVTEGAGTDKAMKEAPMQRPEETSGKSAAASADQAAGKLSPQERTRLSFTEDFHIPPTPAVGTADKGNASASAAGGPIFFADLTLSSAPSLKPEASEAQAFPVASNSQRPPIHLHEAPPPSGEIRSSYDDSEDFADYDEDSEDETFSDSDYEESGFAKRFFFGFFVFFLILCILVLLWAIGGILMDIGWIPRYDLGYQWFNETIYPLF